MATVISKSKQELELAKCKTRGSITYRKMKDGSIVVTKRAVHRNIRQKAKHKVKSGYGFRGDTI